MIFIDTGALVARYITRDQYHVRANECWHKLERTRSELVTSNFVVDEALTLLARRATYAFAVERARSLYASRAMRIMRPTEADELDAISYFSKFADQTVSFTDCVSFALMKRRGIQEVFAFDRHFELAGFKCLS